MDNIKIPGSTRTPAVSFDFVQHRFRISGESYPEDVTIFYNPLLESLDRYLSENGIKFCQFNFELIYFNSSSAKVIMMLMEKLDAAAANGVQVDVHWLYDPEDETMEELGEEFGEDLENAIFHLEKMPR
jgi:hypothetical protein